MKKHYFAFVCLFIVGFFITLVVCNKRNKFINCFIKDKILFNNHNNDDQPDNPSILMETTDLLLEAVQQCDIFKIKKLIDAGVDVNTSGMPAFIWAIDDDEVEIVKMFIEAGMNINKTNEVSLPPLHQAIIWNDNLEILKILLDAGADVNYPDSFKTPLWGAIYIGLPDYNITKYRNERGYRKQRVFDEQVNIEMIKMLIAAGADVNANPERIFDCNAIVMAVQRRNLEIIKILLITGAEAPIHDHEGAKDKFIDLLIGFTIDELSELTQTIADIPMKNKEEWNNLFNEATMKLNELFNPNNK